MGLFSRKRSPQDQHPVAPPQNVPPSPGPIPLYEPVPSDPVPRAPSAHPPSGLAAASPQPEPSPAQFQQQLFHQTYQILQQHQQHPYLQPVGPAGGHYHGYSAGPGGANTTSAAATGTATIGNEQDGAMSSALLRQAVQAAAREGKPLTLNFIAQMQPVMANNQYGVNMPHQHPYGGVPPPYQAGGQPGGQPGTPEGWRPGQAQNPYDAIRIPALPDMRNLPAELQDFRDQCATGVRQAVAMITAMEHQLWWERSRRQQAEEDCKVLLAAVQMERGVGEALRGEEDRRRAEAAQAAGKLTLAADELPQASEAATTIQKHVRGHLARKEFETHLRDILRGVDPSLDPAALPAAAQSHISNVNAAGAPRRPGLRTLLGAVVDRASAGGGGGGALPTEQAAAASYYRREVDRIGKRLAGYKDAGAPHPGDRSGDPLLADVKQLLSGSYPASSAQVIAALVRRCRELQAALLEAVGELEQAQLAIQGLKEANAKVSELSGVRADLEASRQDNLRLAGTVAKLRTALMAQSAASNAGAARENPYIGAWYRKAYADSEWQRIPPGGPGGVGLMDGPDTEVETWDDLRASVPEPVMVPRAAVPGMQYKDLMQLKQDMVNAAQQGPPDPLYSMAVPDRSGFVYERDTPLVPMQSAAPLIRETLPAETFMAVHQDMYRRQQQQQQQQQQQYPQPHLSPRPSAPGTATPTGPYHQQYSYGGGAADGRGDGNLLPSSAVNLSPRALQAQQQYVLHGGYPQGAGGGSGGGGGAYRQLVDQQERMNQQQAAAAAAGPQSAAYGGSSAGGGAGGGGASFRYNRDTPVVPVYSVLPLIREDEYIRRSTSPPPREAAMPPGTPPLHPSAPAADLLPRQTSTPAAGDGGGGLSTNLSYIRDRVPTPPPQPSVPPDVAAAAAAAVMMTPPPPPPPPPPQVLGGRPMGGPSQHQY